MKKLIKISLILFSFLFIISLTSHIFIGNNNFYFKESETNFYTKSTGISIDGNSQLAATATSGSGIENDPYIIQNLVINASGTGNHGISIKNTNEYFILQNCLITDTDSVKYAIYISNVSNGKILNNYLISNDYGGLFIGSCTNMLIFNNSANQNGRTESSGTHYVYVFNINNCNDSRFEYNEANNNLIINSGGTSNIYPYFISDCYDNTFSSNIANQNNASGLAAASVTGFYIRDCNSNVIMKNRAFNNTAQASASPNAYGMRLKETYNNEFIYNSFTHNLKDGIIHGQSTLISSFNIFHKNVIAHNGDNGIELNDHNVTFNQNLICWNSLNPYIDTGSNNTWTDNILSGVFDTDDDGLIDLEEINYNTNPFLEDTDSDLIQDSLEITLGTNPLANDSDDDGYLDGVEINLGTNPLDSNSYPNSGSSITSNNYDVILFLVMGVAIGSLIAISIYLTVRIRNLKKEFDNKIQTLKVKSLFTHYLHL